MPLALSHRTTRIDLASAVVLAIGLVGLAIVGTSEAQRPCVPLPGFLPAFESAMATINLVIAAMLLSHASFAGHAGSLRLGCGYLFSACMIVPHVAAFPGVTSDHTIGGSPSFTPWLWSIWHGGFATCVARYAVGAPSARNGARELRSGVRRTLAIAAMCVGFAASSNWLPSLAVRNGQVYTLALRWGVAGIVLALSVLALIAVAARAWRYRRSNDLWLGVIMLACCVDVWLAIAGASRYAFGWYVGRMAGLVAAGVMLWTVFQDIHAMYGRIVEWNTSLQKLAMFDPLTGLPNRRRFDEGLDIEWRRAQRERRPLSLMMIDVDHFKRFNDRYGHPAGDRCLQDIAKQLAGIARRPGDLAARYGGEEFLLLMPATTLAGATHLAERLRQSVLDLSIKHELTELGLVSVSIGVATILPRTDLTWDALVATADALLYEAKSSGRNRVVADIEEPRGMFVPSGGVIQGATSM